VITTVLIASLAVYSWKLLGYLIPEKRITLAMRAFAERVTIAGALVAAVFRWLGF